MWMLPLYLHVNQKSDYDEIFAQHNYGFPYLNILGNHFLLFILLYDLESFNMFLTLSLLTVKPANNKCVTVFIFVSENKGFNFILSVFFNSK